MVTADDPRERFERARLAVVAARGFDGHGGRIPDRTGHPQPEPLVSCEVHFAGLAKSLEMRADLGHVAGQMTLNAP